MRQAAVPPFWPDMGQPYYAPARLLWPRTPLAMLCKLEGSLERGVSLWSALLPQAYLPWCTRQENKLSLNLTASPVTPDTPVCHYTDKLIKQNTKQNKNYATTTV